MNYISNPKTAKININIVEIDRAIQEQIFSLQDEEIRKLVDERRHLSSLILSMQEPSDEPQKLTNGTIQTPMLNAYWMTGWKR